MATIARNPNTQQWELLVRLSEIEAVSLAERPTAGELLRIASANGMAARIVVL